MVESNRCCNEGDTHDDKCNCSQGCSSPAEGRYPAAAAAAAAIAVFSCRCDRRWEEGGVLGRDDVGDVVVCCLERERINKKKNKEEGYMYANVSRVMII